jgi:hypothetical protein
MVPGPHAIGTVSVRDVSAALATAMAQFVSDVLVEK